MNKPVEIVVPRGAMVVLVGPSGSGKSTFAARHFPPTQVLSSDEMRAVVADDPNDQSATEAAFELLHTALALRLAARRTTVVDATNVERWARGRLLAVARRAGRPAFAILISQPLEVMLARNEARDRPRPRPAIRRQQRWLEEARHSMIEEGFAAVWVLESDDAVAAVSVRLDP